MRICFTGPAFVKGIHYERTHLIALAKEKGHVVQARVDNTTEYLVKGETTKKTKKMAAAKHYFAVVITPEDFLKLMGFL